MTGASAELTVRSLRTDEMRAGADLLAAIWGVAPVEPPLMVALAHSGAYVAGAFADDRLVGASVAYFARPLGDVLHSHVTGIEHGWTGRGVGRALKQHQRDWCLARGLTRITLTFDPLVARNAAFNIAGLGVGITEYLTDFYGDMVDGINAGQGSDRMLAVWDLTESPARRVAQAPDPATSILDAVPADIGGVTASDVTVSDVTAPLPREAAPGAMLATVALPPDIEALRRTHPEAARAWRLAVREALSPRIGAALSGNAAWRVTGFTHGRYLLERQS